RAAKGVRNLVPGKPDESEIFTRITAEEDDLRMPPPKSGHRLSDEQVSRIKAWIEQGARWSGHWAYLPLFRPELPNAGNRGDTLENPIDRFLRVALPAQSLEPAPAADRTTLIRRLSFDLVGLPPTPLEVDRFVADPRADALERLVDRLLAAPAYGE